LKPERFAELDPDKVAAIEKSFFIGQPYPYSFEANSLATILAEALEIRKRSIETGSKTNEYWLSEFSGGLERGDSLGKVAKLSAFFETVKKSGLLSRICG